MDSKLIFTKLKKIIQPYEKGLKCEIDSANEYHLNTRFLMKNKKPLFFGAVKINKNYISYHLMPVYVQPSLLKHISPELKKRMQGKSCFNFKVVDDVCFAELSGLTQSGAQFYLSEGYIS